VANREQVMCNDQCTDSPPHPISVATLLSKIEHSMNYYLTTTKWTKLASTWSSKHLSA